MKMENQNERNGECVKPFDFLAQFSSFYVNALFCVGIYL